MVFRHFVESAVNDLAFNASLHVGNFFGTLVDEQYHKGYVGIIFRNAVRDFFKQCCFARFRGRHNHTALPFSDWRDKVDFADCEVVFAARVFKF